MQETIAAPSRGEIKQFVKRVIIFTALFELLGAVALTLFWLQEFAPGQAVYYGIFHSISAFCTAGFALFDALTANKFAATIAKPTFVGWDPVGEGRLRKRSRSFNCRVFK